MARQTKHIFQCRRVRIKFFLLEITSKYFLLDFSSKCFSPDISSKSWGFVLGPPKCGRCPRWSPRGQDFSIFLPFAGRFIGRDVAVAQHSVGLNQ